MPIGSISRCSCSLWLFIGVSHACALTTYVFERVQKQAPVQIFLYPKTRPPCLREHAPV